MSRPKLSSLEGARAVLALTVCCAHAWLCFARTLGNADAAPAAGAVVSVATLAVTCFFVLSGYVISLSIAANRARNRGFSGTEYLASRVARVLPPILSAIAITWVLAVALELLGASRVDAVGVERTAFVTSPGAQLIALATLTISGELTGGFNGPLWSLVWEIRFYVFAGLLALAGWGGLWARVAAAAGLVAYAWALNLTDPRTLVAAAPVYIEFALGAAAARVDKDSTRPTALLACGLLLAVLTAPTTLGWFTDTGSMPPALRALDFGTEMVVALAFALILVALHRTRGIDGLTALASVSYTLYILHFPLLQAIYFLLFNHAPALLGASWVGVVGPLATALVIAACAVVGWVVERPGVHRQWLEALMQQARSRMGWSVRP